MKRKRVLSILLAVVIIAGTLVIPTQAAEMQTVTSYYVDTFGKTIANAMTSSAAATEAPAVKGYTYTGQSTKTTNVYAEEHIVYIIGYPDGGVKVEQNMTRAEAATVLYRLYNGRIPAFVRRMSNNTFADVNSGKWYYKELETLYNAGIISDTVYFRPDEPISRAEFASLCARYDGLSYVSAGKFSDVKLGHWAYSYINAAAEAGWIEGYPDGTFRPDNNITRAEVMRLVNRLFNRLPTPAQISGVRNPYNDITTAHWAYPDVIEATVKHDAALWHGCEYNEGVYNIIKLHFVDGSGRKIADSVVTGGPKNYHPTELTGYTYQGYITEITYVYSDGKTAPGITKSSNKSTVDVGDTVKYTVTLTNGAAATADWKNVVLTDFLPPHTSLVHGSVYIGGVHAEYSLMNGVLTVPVADIAPGKSAVVTFELLALSTGYGESIKNTASAKGSNGGPVSASDDGTKINQGDILPYAVKTCVGFAKVGDTVIYTIKAGNGAKAKSPWENALLTDTMPAGIDFRYGSVQVNGATANYSYSAATRTLGVGLGDIAPGESVAVTFAATINSGAYGKTIYNTAVLTGNNTPDIPAPDPGIVVGDGAVKPYASKTVSKSAASVGDSLSFTVTVGNSALATIAWKGAVMSDTIPAGLTFTHGSVRIGNKTASYSYSNGILRVELGDIAPDAHMTVTFDCVVNSAAYNSTIKNVAVITGDNTKDPIEAEAPGVPVGGGDANALITKAANKSQAYVNDVITYTIVARNLNGTHYVLENATVADVIPSYLTLDKASIQINGRATSDYSYNSVTRQLTAHLGNIASGGTATITFECKVNPGAEGQFITNTAILSGDNHDPVSAPDNGVEILTHTARPSLTKSAGADKVKVGDVYTYTLEAANSITAQSAWLGVNLTDTIPLGVSFVDGSVYVDGKLASYSYAGRVLTVPLGDIAAGQTVRVTFRVEVKEAARGTTIENVAVAHSSNSGPVSAADNGVHVDSGNAAPYVKKEANVSKAEVGSIVTYTVTLTNGAQATADWEGVTISDIIPDGLSFQLGSVTVNNIAVPYTYAGRALSIQVGNLVPGETVYVKFNVLVTDKAMGKTVYNTVIVGSGNTGDYPATDDGVEVPDEDFGGDKNSVYGSKVADVTTVRTGDYITYTIVAGNSSKNSFTWYNVSLYDIIDTGLTKVDVGSITIDGVKASTGQYSYSGGQLIVKLGTIAVGQEVTVTFKVKVTSEADGELISNTATLKGSNSDGGTFNTTVRINLENEVTVPDDPGLNPSDIHMALFEGYMVPDAYALGKTVINGFTVNYNIATWSDGTQVTVYDGCWMPNDYMTRAQLATILYRYTAKPVIAQRYTIADVKTTNWAYEAVCYSIQEGLFKLDDDYNFMPDDPISQADLGNMFTKVIGNNGGYASAEKITRINVARAVLANSSRSENHNTNGVALPTFYDIPSSHVNYDIIMEISTSHDWFLDGSKEIWDTYTP